MDWHVYIIETDDNFYYTGITKNLEKRFEQHANGSGAKFFNLHTPNRIIYSEDGHTRSSASIREAEIKKLNKKDKINLINNAA
jgi:putative endonuclease